MNSTPSESDRSEIQLDTPVQLQPGSGRSAQDRPADGPGNARPALAVHARKPPGVKHHSPLSESDRCGLVLDTWPCAVQERFALLARKNLSPRTGPLVCSKGLICFGQRFGAACGEEWRRGFAEVPPCGPPHIIMVRKGSDTVRGRRRRGSPTMKNQYNRGGAEVSPSNKHAI